MLTNQTRKNILTNVKRILIKIGSAVLTGEEGLNLNIIEQLVDEIAELKRKGYEVMLVTSGAIASGKHRMGIKGDLKSMPQKQAAAAIGQGRLMRVYSNTFGKHGLFVAQILLTMSDLTDRKRFLNIRNTLSTLMDWGVIAIINENDTVAVDEIKFGDNDHLAATVTNIIGAHLLINLTSTDGLYDRNPLKSGEAKLLPLVEEITEKIEAMATEEANSVGTGGMKSKILAAKKVTAFGIPCIIAPGRRKDVLQDVLAGKEIGTLFLPMDECLTSRKYWIAFTLKSRGKLFIDEGAKKALLEQGKSLLPSGIAMVEGNFGVGDPATCVDRNGTPLAKGLVNYSAAEIRKIMGLKTSEVEQVLGYKDYDEIIHRNNLVLIK
ncbi:MAG: glutamate 5-kinase [Syntrophaceae bacterium CG2_30_49_12]|nr:MAG: glutamate 5-kinase [Syntrophaceae bacterium CG2_30_49_12]PIP05888.1 MAG: glutamate 5-kinase [Syntrophobacterales bacterium CG23_combo_of_CG06-09_8_20_14_all_48_27]PJC73320.1 MAG: glutamate 5-kinase [Syntrophobacterales bacterium CG_4_8_14_3_um_filter_49_14]